MRILWIVAVCLIGVEGSVIEFGKMIQEETEKNPITSYSLYGCYCGLGSKGKPKDATDRWHLDPKKLASMYPNYQPKCWRCGDEDATYFHIWWTCKKVKAFWIKVWWNMQKIFKQRIKFCPQLFLLGIIADATVVDTKLMLNLITAARLLIGQYWKKEELPTIEEWTLKVSDLAEMAKISAYLKDHSQERYIMEWRKWIEFIQNKYRVKKFYVAFE